jgi:hypothetical protein
MVIRDMEVAAFDTQPLQHGLTRIWFMNDAHRLALLLRSHALIHEIYHIIMPQDST